ncbi:pimeloyl-ACP methyl ester esterase BioH [Psychromonas ossibalaenae]|uniref:pimeloyl-ACP methyl ester esterase BioH n=1 Tax=Psychromonas ossibalaenae TaxID=444922 RepID=UPI000367A904|nr:pimeloyl-ACP methyl ester esterase BioH [Psychromonas ossibalaenae]
MSIEQTVYCRVIGEGKDLVLLHGWGVNSVVWTPVVEQLSKHFRLHLIDLPGFGRSGPLTQYNLQEIVDAVVKVVPNSAVWCGWSLGGLIATYAALKYPQKIQKLIQVSASPKFVSEENWPGVESSVFNNFKSGVENNCDKTLARFIGLQAMGCVSARKDTVILKKLLASSEKAQLTALLSGLDLLNECDLRSEFRCLKVPCLSLFGLFDSLVPVQAGREMQCLLPESKQKIFINSSHAPFVSEADDFCKTVINFAVD